MKLFLVFVLFVGIFLPTKSEQGTELAKFVSVSLDKILDWVEILFRNFGKGAAVLEQMLTPRPGSHTRTPKIIVGAVRMIKNAANTVADALQKPEEEKRDLTPVSPVKRLVTAIVRVAPKLVPKFLGEMIDTLIYYIPEVRLGRCIYRYMEQHYPKIFNSLLDSKITIIRVGAKVAYYVVQFVKDIFDDGDKDSVGREIFKVSVYRNDKLGKLHDIMSYLKSYIKEIFFIDETVKDNLEQYDEEVVNFGMCFKVYSLELLFRLVEIFM